MKQNINCILVKVLHGKISGCPCLLKKRRIIYKYKNCNIKTWQINNHRTKCEWSYRTQYVQIGFFRTSMIALFEVSGPTLRLERRDSLRDFTTGRAVSPPQDPKPVWTTRLTGASPAARRHNSSMTVGSSVGSDERLHVDGRGVFTSSRISSLDLGGLSDCPTPLPPVLSSGQRVSFSMLPADFPSHATTERQQQT